MSSCNPRQRRPGSGEKREFLTMNYWLWAPNGQRPGVPFFSRLIIQDRCLVKQGIHWLGSADIRTSDGRGLLATAAKHFQHDGSNCR